MKLAQGRELLTIDREGEKTFSPLLLLAIVLGVAYEAILLFSPLLSPYRFPIPFAVPIFDTPFVLVAIGGAYFSLERHRLRQDFHSVALGAALWLAALLGLAHILTQPDYPGTAGVNPGVAPYFFFSSYLAAFAAIGLATHYGDRHVPLSDRGRFWIATGTLGLSILLVLVVLQIRPFLPSLVMRPGRLTPFAIWVAGASNGLVAVWALWGARKKVLGKEQDLFAAPFLLATFIWLLGLTGFLIFPFRYSVSWYIAGLARPLGVAVIFVGLLREQVWLYREARARQRDLESLHAAGQALVTSLDPEQIVDTITTKALEVSGADGAVLFQLDPETQVLRAVSGAGPLGQEYATGLELPRRIGVAGLAVAERQAVWTSNAQIDERIALTPEARERMSRQGLKACLSIPLVIERGKVFGTLSIYYREEREFADTDIELLSAYGTQVAVAIENARAYAELQANLQRLQETQAQLIQADKLKALGTLLSGMTHELNNPLASILLSAQFLKQRQDLPDPVRRRLDAIEQECKRASQIIKDLLGFARRQPPERRRVNFNEVIKAALALQAPAFDFHQIRVATDLAPALPEVWADSNQLQQVFLNLFSNATHAMKSANGRKFLTVRSSLRGPEVRAEVDDAGPGIAPEHLGRIFDPFFTTKPSGEGTGLGLSLSIGIVEAHGGRMGVENLPGSGTRFTVTLPIGEKVEPVKTPSVEAPTTVSRRARILVVDDEEPLREILTEIFTGLGHEVESVSTGRGSITAMEKQAFDLVILDLRLPDIDGKEVWQWILSRNPALASRVVFITGDIMSTETEEFLQTTKRPVFTKPLTMEQVHRGVGEILSDKPAQ